MSRYFPHASYAEDQPLSRTILATHVLSRGYTTGAVVGLGLFSAGSLVRRLRGTGGGSSINTITNLLRTTGTASVVGVGLMAVALAGMMRGREEIEWRDRAWRLMENRGQLETDDWTYGGAVAGLIMAGARGGTGSGGWRAGAGAAGLGSVAGTVGYLVWRHGLHRGRFPGYVGDQALKM